MSDDDKVTIVHLGLGVWSESTGGLPEGAVIAQVPNDADLSGMDHEEIADLVGENGVSFDALANLARLAQLFGITKLDYAQINGWAYRRTPITREDFDQVKRLVEMLT